MSIRKHPTQPGVWQIIVSQGRKGKQLVFSFECTETEAIIKDKKINAQIKGERLTAFCWASSEGCHFASRGGVVFVALDAPLR